MTSIIFNESYLSRDKAEFEREKFMDLYKADADDVFVIEDEIKFINNHYVVRIMLQNKQTELDFD